MVSSTAFTLYAERYGQQLDELEGWLDRQKDHDAGDWPEAGEFTGGKHDRHASADDFQA